jgi:hypothetical protein
LKLPGADKTGIRPFEERGDAGGPVTDTDADPRRCRDRRLPGVAVLPVVAKQGG